MPKFRVLYQVSKYKNKIDLFFELVCFALMIIKIASLFVFNLTHLRCVVDYDSATALTQVLEIWKQKTLFINGWGYASSLVWDSSLLLAVPLYGLTKDVFIAYGLSNNCLILVFTFFLNRICNDLNLNRAHKYFSISLVFTIFTHHQLGYIDCLFTNAAHYGWRVLSIIVLLSIMIRLISGKSISQQYGSVAVCYLLLFVSGASSGSYILICGIFPLIIYLCLNYIMRNQLKIIKESQTIFLFLAVISLLAGMIVSKLIYPVNLWNNVNARTLSSADDFLQNIGKSLVGILELLGGITSVEHPAVFSSLGIKTLLGFVVVSALFISAWMTIRKSLQRYVYDTSTSVQYGMMMLWLFVVNAFCLSYVNITYGVATFEYRYWLIAIVPTFVLIGIYLSNLEQCNKILSRALFLCVIIASALFSMQTIKSYYNSNGDADVIEAVLREIAEKKDIETLYVIDPGAEGRIMPVLTTDFDVIPVNRDLTRSAMGMKTSGFSSNSMAVLAQKDVVSANPVLRGACTVICSFEYGQYNLYDCNAGIFDFDAGLPRLDEKEAWDWPTSNGYCIAETKGSINEAGEAESYRNADAGHLLFGPYTESVPGTYDIILHYVIDSYEEEDEAVFDIALDTQSQANIPIHFGAISATLENINIEMGHTFEARVWIPKGMVMRVQSIEYKRVG